MTTAHGPATARGQTTVHGVRLLALREAGDPFGGETTEWLVDERRWEGGLAELTMFVGEDVGVGRLELRFGFADRGRMTYGSCAEEQERHVAVTVGGAPVEFKLASLYRGTPNDGYLWAVVRLDEARTRVEISRRGAPVAVLALVKRDEAFLAALPPCEE